MGDLVRAERVYMDTRGCPGDPGEDLLVGLYGKIRVNPGEQADFGDVPPDCERHLLFDLLPVITICPFITRAFPEATKTAEIFTDIRDVDILVPHVRDGIAGFFLPHFICGSEDRKYLAAPEVEEAGRLLLSQAVPLPDVV
jgi:hypothetical protein